MNEKLAKFIIANWKLLQKVKMPPEILGMLFFIGVRGHEIKKRLEDYLEEKTTA